ASSIVVPLTGPLPLSVDPRPPQSRTGPRTSRPWARPRGAGSPRSRHRASRSPAHLPRVLAVPRDRALDPLAQAGPRLPAGRTQARHVEALLRRAVRHRGVPGRRAVVADDVGDRLGDLADRHVLA